MHIRSSALAPLVTALALIIGLTIVGNLPAQPPRTLIATPVTPTVPAATPTSTTLPVAAFQNGIAYPRWGANRYADSDTEWVQQLPVMHDRTRAPWVELIVSVEQDYDNSTNPYAGASTSTPEALGQGIRRARHLGMHVFVIMHINVNKDPIQWSGDIHFSSRGPAQQWFTNYWNVMKPFVVAAAQNGAEEFGIGNEYDGLESAPSDLWSTLIDQTHSVFPGAIMYATNHGHITPQPWMKSPNLALLGVSAYESLVAKPQVLSEPEIEALWRAKVLPQLDALSAATGKPVLVSEIGYHATADALYHPWAWTTGAQPAPQLQADAYRAAITVSRADPHVAGIFLWGWGPSVGPFAPADPAVSVLHDLYK